MIFYKRHFIFKLYLQSVELVNAGFIVETVRLSSLISDHPLTEPKLIRGEDDYDFYRRHMAAGDRIRIEMGRGDAVSLAGLAELLRLHDKNHKAERAPIRIAYIIHSFCHQAEITLMRRLFDSRFFLVAAFQAEKYRKDELHARFALPDLSGEELDQRVDHVMQIDIGLAPSSEIAADPKFNRFRLSVRKTFHLADLFISCENSHPTARGAHKLRQLVAQVCAHPFNTPDRHEMAMAYAYQAAARSGDLSRQVGAAITTPSGDLLAVGTNDVPKFGGGLYWQSVNDLDNRDHARGFDSNEKIKYEIIEELLMILENEGALSGAFDQAALSDLLEEHRFGDARIFDITEYGRTVHAEMDAITTAARHGRSIQGCTLYATTFPCHECARHIIAAGIVRVIYVEPYPKSRVAELHDDTVILGDTVPLTESPAAPKVRFEPFIGISPRRHADLFGFVPRKRRDALSRVSIADSPWESVPWRLAPSVDLRWSVVGRADPFFDQLDRATTWNRVRAVVSQSDALTREILEVRRQPPATGGQK